MAIAYKLTNDKLQSRGGYQWVVGEWREVSGAGELCGPGWLHFYESPEMAALFSPIYSHGYTLLWRAEVDGGGKFDSCVKFGATRGRLLEKAELPAYTTTQRIAFGILCAYPWASTKWQEWADKWLSGADRSPQAALAVAKAVADDETESEYRAALAANMDIPAQQATPAQQAALAGAEAGTEWSEPGSASRSDTDEALYVLLCAEAAKDF